MCFTSSSSARGILGQSLNEYSVEGEGARTGTAERCLPGPWRCLFLGGSTYQVMGSAVVVGGREEQGTCSSVRLNHVNFLGADADMTWPKGQKCPLPYGAREPPTPVVVLEAEAVAAATVLSCKEVISALWDEWG